MAVVRKGGWQDMSELEELYAQISQDKKLVRKWQREANKRIKRFVKNIAGASPFLDKPVKRMFGVRNSKDGQSLTRYGTSPNAGRMKGFNAPVNEWRQTAEAFRIFGEGGWRTIHKVQMVNTSAGVPIQDVPYFGTSEQPDRYFGIRKGKVTLAYGKTKGGLGVPVYAQDSFADWLMAHHGDELENLILECGRDVLADFVAKGGSK